MTYSSDPAQTAGPEGNGAKSLAKESKVGLFVSFVVFGAAQGLVDALTNVDLNGQTGWWVTLASAGVAGAIGTISAWLKKNR